MQNFPGGGAEMALPSPTTLENSARAGTRGRYDIINGYLETFCKDSFPVTSISPRGPSAWPI
jgi:hypothetical protein